MVVWRSIRYINNSFWNLFRSGINWNVLNWLDRFEGHRLIVLLYRKKTKSYRNKISWIAAKHNKCTTHAYSNKLVNFVSCCSLLRELTMMLWIAAAWSRTIWRNKGLMVWSCYPWLFDLIRVKEQMSRDQMFYPER